MAEGSTALEALAAVDLSVVVAAWQAAAVAAAVAAAAAVVVAEFAVVRLVSVLELAVEPGSGWSCQESYSLQ